ncbi:hypothetical protein GCWB2_08630 [Gordonia rubripertincta]|nr:hypothetical protein GCWB2_08630 [Gordonia rubripertincta]
MIVNRQFALLIRRFQPLGGHVQYTVSKAGDEFDSA